MCMFYRNSKFYRTGQRYLGYRQFVTLVWLFRSDKIVTTKPYQSLHVSHAKSPMIGQSLSMIIQEKTTKNQLLVGNHRQGIPPISATHENRDQPRLGLRPIYVEITHQSSRHCPRLGMSGKKLSKLIVFSMRLVNTE